MVFCVVELLLFVNSRLPQTPSPYVIIKDFIDPGITLESNSDEFLLYKDLF